MSHGSAKNLELMAQSVRNPTVKVDLRSKGIKSIHELSIFEGTFMSLNLSNNHIEDLEGCQLFTQLKKLKLSNNSISDISALASLPQLVSVDLSHNMLATLDQLGALSSLNHLKEIVLFGNPLCEEEMYYEKVFALQPSLTFVDMRSRPVIEPSPLMDYLRAAAEASDDPASFDHKEAVAQLIMQQQSQLLLEHDDIAFARYEVEDDWLAIKAVAAYHHTPPTSPLLLTHNANTHDIGSGISVQQQVVLQEVEVIQEQVVAQEAEEQEEEAAVDDGHYTSLEQLHAALHYLTTVVSDPPTFPHEMIKHITHYYVPGDMLQYIFDASMFLAMWIIYHCSHKFPALYGNDRTAVLSLDGQAPLHMFVVSMFDAMTADDHMAFADVLVYTYQDDLQGLADVLSSESPVTEECYINHQVRNGRTMLLSVKNRLVELKKALDDRKAAKRATFDRLVQFFASLPLYQFLDEDLRARYPDCIDELLTLKKALIILVCYFVQKQRIEENIQIRKLFFE